MESGRETAFMYVEFDCSVLLISQLFQERNRFRFNNINSVQHRSQ